MPVLQNCVQQKRIRTTTTTTTTTREIGIIIHFSYDFVGLGGLFFGVSSVGGIFVATEAGLVVNGLLELETICVSTGGIKEVGIGCSIIVDELGVLFEDVEDVEEVP